MEDLEGTEVVQVGESNTYELQKGGRTLPSFVRLLKALQTRIDPTGNGGFRQFTDRLFWKAYAMANFPDPQKGWRAQAINEAIRIASEERFDLILSSSSPFTTHMIAHTLSDELRIPWVAEYRDLWSQNHNSPFGPILRLYAGRLETRTVRSATAIVTVSPFWAKDLESLHPGKRIESFTNGFDPQRYPPCKKDRDKFVITYAGQIYWGKQNPNIILEAISTLIASGKLDETKVELRFYGPHDDRLSSLIDSFRLSSVARQYGVVPRQESISKQCESNAVLLLAWDDPSQPGWIPLKLVEYLGCCNPIIATGGSPSSIISDILRSTNAGFSCTDVNETASALLQLYRSALEGHQDEMERKVDEIKKFDFSEISRNYAKFLDEIALTLQPSS
jgi:hypothetical protein